MLFLATHVHTEDNCLAHDPEQMRATFGQVIAGAEELGVTLVGAYSDAPAHTVYILFEADTAEQIEQFFDPALEVGHIDVRPVTDAMKAYGRRAEGN